MPLVDDVPCRVASTCDYLPRRRSLPDTKMWGVKPFYQSHWWEGVGKTIWYGEWAQYEDFYGLALAQGLGGFNNCTQRRLLDPRFGAQSLRRGRGAGNRLRCHASLAPLAASRTRCRPGRQRPRRCQVSTRASRTSTSSRPAVSGSSKPQTRTTRHGSRPSGRLLFFPLAKSKGRTVGRPESRT